MMRSTLRSVLVVDDDFVGRETARQRILALGYRVNAREKILGASAWIKKHRPWLVVLDAAMPNLAGSELAETIFGRGLEVPIIVHSETSADEPVPFHRG